MAAASTNVSAPTVAPFVDRSVHYDRLSESAARQLESIARDAAQRAVLEVNRAAIALVDAEPDDAPSAPQRVNFGVYVYRDDDEASSR